MESGRDPYLCEQNEEQPKDFAGRILKE